MALLEKRLEVEENDELRDQIFLALQSSWAASGRVVTREEVEARIERVKGQDEMAAGGLAR